MQVTALICFVCCIIIPVLGSDASKNSTTATNSSSPQTNSTSPQTNSSLPTAFVSKRKVPEEPQNVQVLQHETKTQYLHLPLDLTAVISDNKKPKRKSRDRSTTEASSAAEEDATESGEESTTESEDRPSTKAPKRNANQAEQQKKLNRDRIYQNQVKRTLSRVLPAGEIEVLKILNDVLAEVTVEVLELCGSVEREEIPPTPFVDCKYISAVQKAQCDARNAPVGNHPLPNLPKQSRYAVHIGPISTEEDEQSKENNN